MAALNFRLATEDDAAVLEQLINTAFRADKTTQVFLSADHAGIDVTDVAALKASIASPERVVYVGTDPQGRIAAHGSVRRLEDGRAWFGLLAVDVARQGAGLGKQVLTYAEEYARREWGAARMEFDVVRTREDLIAWYGRRGYRPTGETAPFPYDAHGDWRGVLRDDLYFIMMGKDLVDSSVAETVER
ncbi:uncharacterized protein E0L32_000300 [Thyridium curvatum]|uniref:N-acetyltransferase domain-containing protein n=1 Tax=Thyridium curvatum TaxID=1093900 RepID=A0A507B9V2_9PEZI|nr:uncharacterized protein E0L32_000300 [Thyridium curvatum]TPX15966.1 hypothetical protein E0L32_000300 [Thyridium curvatum]